MTPETIAIVHAAFLVGIITLLAWSARHDQKQAIEFDQFRKHIWGQFGLLRTDSTRTWNHQVVFDANFKSELEAVRSDIATRQVSLGESHHAHLRDILTRLNQQTPDANLMRVVEQLVAAHVASLDPSGLAARASASRGTGIPARSPEHDAVLRSLYSTEGPPPRERTRSAPIGATADSPPGQQPDFGIPGEPHGLALGDPSADGFGDDGHGDDGSQPPEEQERAHAADAATAH